MKDEFGGEGVDLYDDVIAAPADGSRQAETTTTASSQAERSENPEANGGYHHIGNNLAPNHIGRRHQLYVGNLTWVCMAGISVCPRGEELRIALPSSDRSRFL